MRSASRRGSADGDAAIMDGAIMDAAIMDGDAAIFALHAASRSGASLIASGVGTSTASTRWTMEAPAGTSAFVTLATAPDSVLTATAPDSVFSMVSLVLGSQDLTVAPLVSSED